MSAAGILEWRADLARFRAMRIQDGQDPRDRGIHEPEGSNQNRQALGGPGGGLKASGVLLAQPSWRNSKGVALNVSVRPEGG